MGLGFGVSGIIRTAPRTVAGDLRDVLHKHALWITLYATAQYAECHWQIDAHFCGFRCGQLSPARCRPFRASTTHECRKAPELPLLWGIRERVGGQVQPRPAAVDELVEVAGQALLEIVVFRAGTDGFLDVGRAVDAERHGPHLPVITLRAVVPALHRSHLARTGIARNRLPVRPLPFRTPRVR